MVLAHVLGNPRRVVIAAVILAIGLIAGAIGQARPAAAQAPVGYGIELTFNTITLYDYSDCVGCGALDVYGTLKGMTNGASAGGTGRVRNFGTWGQDPSWCPDTSWSAGTGYGPCPKQMVASTYAFGSTALCKSSTALYCEGPYLKTNHKVMLTVYPGESIQAAINAKDHDSSSADDTVCQTSKWVGPFTAFQLSTLNQTHGMGMAWNGNGSCTVSFTVKRV